MTTTGHSDGDKPMDASRGDGRRDSGRRCPGRAADVEAKSNELLAQVRSNRLRAIGSASPAQCNPPWTLWFMRRNEVMVEVER